MKKMITILVMLLIAATAYNQSSRRTTNSNETASKNAKEVSRSSTTRTTAANTTASQRNTNNAVVKTRRTDTDNTMNQNRTTTVKTTSTRTQPAAAKPRTQGNNTTSEVTASRSHKASPAKETEREYKSSSNRTRTTAGSNAVNGNSSQGGSNAYHANHLTYKEYYSPRIYREQHTVIHHYHYVPASKEYRARYYAYRRPAEFNIIWTPVMYRNYIRIYPMVQYWHYTNGYHIGMISAYDAEYYKGEVMTVYGKVTEVYYSRTTDEYFLYFGLYYPYQDFTIVMPGYLARTYSHRPDRFFEDEHLAVTGLITTFNGEPEIVVKESFQINLY
jgi:hypothetical protein